MSDCLNTLTNEVLVCASALCEIYRYQILETYEAIPYQTSISDSHFEYLSVLPRSFESQHVGKEANIRCPVRYFIYCVIFSYIRTCDLRRLA